MMICVRGSCKTDNLVFFCLVPDMIPGQICIRKPSNGGSHIYTRTRQ